MPVRIVVWPEALCGRPSIPNLGSVETSVPPRMLGVSPLKIASGSASARPSSGLAGPRAPMPRPSIKKSRIESDDDTRDEYHRRRCGASEGYLALHKRGGRLQRYFYCLSRSHLALARWRFGRTIHGNRLNGFKPNANTHHLTKARCE